ncbi:hypothetical protein R5R35_010876 [Gryllus longicercus]|uniref:Uncharacterized protein n=1 Tax=Gryllus longicercus TaxID=2509291 RepID=A0AAN9V7T6_9ORTH
MATNTTPPSANSLYWTKENKEHRSFVGHENDLILGLENQLELKEKELEVLQKSLSEKEEVLKNTLSFLESLTMKLVEYEQALEKTRKEKEMYSDKIETFHKENKDLKMQVQELKVQNNVNNDQIASFKEKLFKEVVSLNPNRSSQITNSSEPNEIFNILVNCIMEKQMEEGNDLEEQLKKEMQKPLTALLESKSNCEEQLNIENQISINVPIKDNVMKQELLSQIQSLQDEKKEYELRLKKVTEQLQFRLSDLDKRAAQQDERAKECEEAQVDLAEMLQFRESKISWDGNKYVKEMELKQISDSRKLPLMQSKYTRHNLPLHNNKKQLIDEIEAKTDLENKLLIMQNELTAAKNSEHELHQEKEKINKENIVLRQWVKDLDTEVENQWFENLSLRSTLKTLFRIFRGVVQEQESPVEKLNSIIRHLRTHGISVPSESTFEKEKLESKIAELEKTVESLHETLRREGYHYSSPHWVRMGDWAISNRKMKQLEKKNPELQEEVEKLKSNKGSPASDQGLLDDTLFGKCLKSPKSPENVLRQWSDEPCTYWKELLATPATKNAFSHLQDECDLGRIETFCRSLDEYMDGGVPLQRITEFSGAPGSGKTQMWCVKPYLVP